MPNANLFGRNVEGMSYNVIGLFIGIAILVIVAYVFWFGTGSTDSCPKTLHREHDGSLVVKPQGRYFPDLNAFQQWWHATNEFNGCPLPVLTGARERPVLQEEDRLKEETYAKTPINKVDDYEFSRIFGYERNGRMEVPRQNYNVLLNQRAFDWPDKPLSSDERRAKYKGLHEGFTAAGDLKSVVLGEPTAQELAKEATQRYGENRMYNDENGLPAPFDSGRGRRERRDRVAGYNDDEDPDDFLAPMDDRRRRRRKEEVEDDDIKCTMSRESREVAEMVAKAYKGDRDYEPVVTKVGANHWEVNELKPRRRKGGYEEPDPADNRVVNTANDAVDAAFEYRQKEVTDNAIDPYFPTGDLPYYSEHQNRGDKWAGPVPGMERMFGPTFDHKDWIVRPMQS